MSSSACFYHHRRHHCQRARRTGTQACSDQRGLLAHLPELQQLCCPETLNLCSIDSTDLGPEHWLMMAKADAGKLCALRWLCSLPRHRHPGLLGGGAVTLFRMRTSPSSSRVPEPISNEITDAKKNLRDSVICALDPGSRGVMVVFGGHVIAGTRAKKNKTISYDAFASVNFRRWRWCRATGWYGMWLRPGPPALWSWPGAEPQSVPAQADPGLGPELIQPSFNNMTVSLWKALAWAVFPSGSWMPLPRSWATTTRPTRS